MVVRVLVGIVLLVIGLTLAVFLYNNFPKLVSGISGIAGPPEVVYQVEKPQSPRVGFSAVVPGGFALNGPAGLISIVNSDSRPINLTGWLIKANRGSYMIGKAIEVYEPHGLTAVGDIFLRPGGVIHIYTQPGPISFNFQVNKCLGYLQKTFKFSPPLTLSCPRPSYAEIANLSGLCQEYIRYLGSCQLPADNLPIRNDYACNQKLREINYRGCFEKHRNDPDFLTGEWRLYGSGQVLDPFHDQVMLMDEKGRGVDSYVY